MINELIDEKVEERRTDEESFQRELQKLNSALDRAFYLPRESDERKEARLLKAIAKRNEFLYDQFQDQINHDQVDGKNQCELLTTKTEIPLEWRIYHSGPMMQHALQDGEPDFEDYSLTPNLVFFSLYFEGEPLDRLHLHDTSEPLRMMYVSDIRTLRDSHIQKDYDDDAVWKDRLWTLIRCYEEPGFLEEKIESKDFTTQYVLPFKNRPKTALREAIIEEIKKWLPKYTIPFNLEDLQKYKKDNWNWILISTPVKIKYRR